MQEKNLYEYAVIRVVPRVEREEFLNVGVILFCKSAKFIKMLYSVNEAKLLLFSEDFDLEQLELNLASFQTIADGSKAGGPIGEFDIPSRFRWLLSNTNFQTAYRFLHRFG